MNLIKNISKSEVHVLKDQVTYQEGQVVSKTLAQNDAVSITLFAFDKDEAISTHESGGDAFVTCLDGVGRITIDGVEYILHEGESIVMPAKQVTNASPPDSCVLIASSLSKANNVIDTASFWASVLLTTCPS
jgi:quercetin dioxygenase-like cupin family protein